MKTRYVLMVLVDEINNPEEDSDGLAGFLETNWDSDELPFTLDGAETFSDVDRWVTFSQEKTDVIVGWIKAAEEQK